MKKNVLIVSYTYPPSNAPAAQRPHALAKYLDKSKYNVSVITCGNSDSSMGFDNSFNPELSDVKLIKIDALIGAKVAGLRKYKTVASNASTLASLKSKVFNLGTSILVPDKAIFWFPNVKKYLKTHKDFMNSLDVVFTTSPVFTNHLVGRFIKKRKPAIQWISDLRDFHYVEHMEYFKGIKSFLNKKLELSVVKKSNNMLFISNAMREIYANHYKDFASKMEVLYNGFDIEDFKDLDVAPIANKKISIFYAGSFYGGVRSPIPLFRIIDSALEKNILDINEVEVVIAGNLEDTLEEELMKYKSFSCLNYIGRIPRGEVLSRLTTSSILWLIVGEKITHYTGVPIKFYEYMAARRPVLNFAPLKSEPTTIISENNLGWNIDVKNDSIVEQTKIFKEIVISFRTGKLNDSLSSALLDKYSRKHQTKIFESLID